MNKSISHFEDISTKVFQKITEDFFKNPKDFASFISGITDDLHKIGRIMIKETLEEMDTNLRDNAVRKRNWVIENRPDKQLVTVLGMVNFKKTFLQIK